MKLTQEHAQAQYHSPMKTEGQCGESMLALMREMEISKFCEGTGLKREETTLVVHKPSKKAFIQWTGAVPQVIEEAK